MKHCFLIFYCLLPFFSWGEISSQKSELERIELEITVLKNQLNHEQLVEMKEEVKGQGLMIADWSGYSNELEIIRQQDEQEKKIQKKIDQLEERRKSLLNFQKP